MKRLVNKSKLSKRVLTLMVFVDDQNYDEWVMLQELRRDVREYFYELLDFDVNDDVERNNYIKEIRSVDYWKIKNTTYQQQWNYTYFAEELNHALELDFNKNRKVYKMERQVSPPLVAFFPINKFKPTGRDYGLLFE
jgi:hypothetical protein